VKRGLPKLIASVPPRQPTGEPLSLSRVFVFMISAT
jgi:hypothetical protein